MSQPNFSSSEQDRYDAEVMSLKSLIWQTQNHKESCECPFCTELELRRLEINFIKDL